MKRSSEMQELFVPLFQGISKCQNLQKNEAKRKKKQCINNMLKLLKENSTTNIRTENNQAFPSPMNTKARWGEWGNGDGDDYIMVKKYYKVSKTRKSGYDHCYRKLNVR